MNKVIVQHIRSFLSGKKPKPSDIKVGEIGINFPDKKVYSKNDSDDIVQIGAGELHSLEDVSSTKGTKNQFLKFDEEWSASTISPSVTVTLLGPITGNASATLSNLTSNTVTLTTNIEDNSIELGKHTKGNYVSSLNLGTGIHSEYTPGENSVANLWIGQNVDTDASVEFSNVAVTNRVTAGSLVGIGAGYNNEVFYTTPGTYTWNIPPGTDKFHVLIAGGAGSGGSASSGLLAPRRIGHGGNSGAVCWKTYKTVPGKDSVSIIVGTGGMVTAVNQKSDGGNTIISYNNLIMQADGGKSGNHYDEDPDQIPATFSGADFGIPGTVGNSGTNGMGSANGSPLGLGNPAPSTSGTSASIGNDGIGYNSPGAGGDTGINNSSRRGGNGTGGLVIIKY